MFTWTSWKYINIHVYSRIVQNMYNANRKYEVGTRKKKEKRKKKKEKLYYFILSKL